MPYTDEDIAKLDAQNNGNKTYTDSDISNLDANPERKPFYDALGANLTQDQKNANPDLAGIEQTAQDVGTLGYKAADGLTLGLLSGQLKKHGIEPPNFDNTAKENKSVLNISGDALNMGSTGATIGTLAKPVIAGVKALPIIVNAARNNIARMALNPIFKQTASDFKYNHDARRVLTSMPDVVGNDVESTQAAVKNKLNETGQALSDTISSHPNANVKTDVKSQIIDPINEKLKELNINPNQNSASITKLEKTRNDLLNNYDANGINPKPINFSNMTPQQILDYRMSKIDPQVNFTGLTKDQEDVNEVLQNIRGNLKNTMNSVIPDLKPLNQDYGDLKSADDALQRLAFKKQGEPFPKIKIEDIATLGINHYLDNPINKIKFAQWLYTAPKQQIAQAVNRIPNFQQVIQKTYGGVNPNMPGYSSTSPTPAGYVPPVKPSLFTQMKNNKLSKFGGQDNKGQQDLAESMFNH